MSRSKHATVMGVLRGITRKDLSEIIDSNDEGIDDLRRKKGYKLEKQEQRHIEKFEKKLDK